MKVIGYVRVSTAEQADEGFSLAQQRKAIESEAERRGWELVEVIEDAGYTGRNENRPGLQRALRMLATRHGPKAIMAVRLDRLTRSLKYLAAFIELSAKQRWGVVAMDRDIDTTTANGRMLAHMMGVVAQWESEVNGERVSAGMREAYAQARSKGEPTRFGFQRQVPDDVVRRIVRARSKGEPYNKIAARLDRTKVPTPGKSKCWYPSTVARIYENATKVAS